MADVFISYAASDKDRVEPIVTSLIGSGLSVWWDNRIGIGSSFDQEIELRLEQARCVVVFWTEKSIQSDWVRAEAEDGFSRGILVPVCLDDVKPPLAFRRAQSANFHEESRRLEENQKLLSAIQGCLSAGDSPTGQARSIEENLVEAESHNKRSLGLFLALLAIVVISSLIFLGYISTSKPSTKAAALESIRQARALLSDDRYMEAFVLLNNNEIPQTDSTQDLWDEIQVDGIPAVSTQGISISFKPYTDRSMDWIQLGESPLELPVALPKGELLLKFETKDQTSLEVVARNPGPMFGNTEAATPNHFGQNPVWNLARPTGLGSDMVIVPTSHLPMFYSGYPGIQPLLNTPEFAISKMEVTNQEFKEFIEDGGYEEPTFWSSLVYVREGIELTFDEARKYFVDQTDRLGPASWELGNFLEGQAQQPVGGLSWYEAVAYARYRQALLPTVHHWIRASFGPLEPFFPLEGVITHDSNFGTDGPVAVSSPLGIGPWGTLNTAGNVREWVWNSASDQAIIMGGSWKDYGEYSGITKVGHFDRRLDNGLRLMQRLSTNEIDRRLLAPVSSNFSAELIARTPISTEAFEAFRAQFSAPHRKPVNVSVAVVKETDIYFVEKHLLEFAGEEELTVFFFVPRGPKAPWQPILYAPPSDALQRVDNLKALEKIRNFDYILRGGRAIVFPVWYGHYERSSGNRTLPDAQAQSERERVTVLGWYRDSMDVIDYLESQANYDTSSLSIFGVSLGAASLAPLLLAIEPRIKSAILLAGGTYNDRAWHPFADTINYAPHVLQPVLMLNGRYDNFFPLEVSAQRLFNLLGSPTDQKKMVVFDGGHIDWPSNRKVIEVSDWLDAQMGLTR